MHKSPNGRKHQELPPRKKGAAIVAHLRGRGDIATSTDAIMALTRGEDSAHRSDSINCAGD